MNRIRSSEELKAHAREKLLDRYLQVVPVHLLFLFVSWGFKSLGADLLYTKKGFFMSFVALGIYLIGSVLANLLRFGLDCFYMNLSCGFPCGIGDLFRGFSFRDDRAVRVSLLYTGMLFLCELPAVFLLVLQLRTGSAALSPLAMLALCVGLGVYCVYWLGMSQCYYLILDFPDKDLGEIIRMSRWLMKGNRIRLFYLHISFVPLYILSLLPCGIGFFWTLPYAEESFTCFHLNLTSVAASEQ
ncbi:MAG: DUF975 family protein [Lachnospiraceae bacterium]|nr:DUF975 family protein [Lachnospiraceae bacterium]